MLHIVASEMLLETIKTQKKRHISEIKGECCVKAIGQKAGKAGTPPGIQISYLRELCWVGFSLCLMWGHRDQGFGGVLGPLHRAVTHSQ